VNTTGEMGVGVAAGRGRGAPGSAISMSMPRGSGQRPSALHGVEMVCVSPFGMYMLTNSASRTHRHCSMLAPPSGDVHVQKQAAITGLLPGRSCRWSDIWPCVQLTL